MITTAPPRAEPPGPVGSFLVGCLWDFHHDPIKFLEQNAREFGDVSHFRFFHLPVYQVNHPDDVRTVLLDSDGSLAKGMAMEGFRPLVGKGLLLNEGESHRRQRRLMQPAFQRHTITGYGEQMIAEIVRVRDRWRDGQEVDMGEEMTRMALAIATSTLFGTDLSPQETQDVTDAVAAFAYWYHQSTHPLGPLLQLLPTRSTRRFRHGKQKLSAVVRRMIHLKRENAPAKDILSTLVYSQDPEHPGATMSDEQLHDEALTLLIAGHETTGATLTWAWWLLSLHPEVADRLHQEVLDAVGGRTPTPEDVPGLPYAEMVFAETLRLYPPAMALPRQATRPVPLGNFEAPTGAIIMAAAWCTHRDARFWESPDRFIPERWTREARASRPRFAYYPFGGGARTCIGESFAWLEGTLALSILAQRWRAELRPGWQVETKALFTLRPKGGMPMFLRRRP